MRVAHPRLRRQVDNELRVFGGKQVRHTFTIFEVKPSEPESLVRLQPSEPGFLQRHVVVVVQVIEAHHLVAAIQQPLSRRDSQ